MNTFRSLLALFFLQASFLVAQAIYTPLWNTLPKPPPMPKALRTDYAKVNNVSIWYAQYGSDLKTSQTQGNVPLVFLHGGLANSEYWANQILHLQNSSHTLITIDSRGQGRSTDDLSHPITYDLMTQDVIAVMDHLNITRFSPVGWSDGAILTFDLAMNYSARIDRIFAFGGSFDSSNSNATSMNATTTSTFAQWARRDYARLSPGKGSFDGIAKRMLALWAVEPNWDGESFARIPTLEQDPERNPIVWIVGGDSEEVVTRSTPGKLHDMIWGSSLVILPSVSHFAFLQDPATANAMLDRWLAWKR